MTQATLQTIHQELKNIKSKLDFIEEHMVDIDSMMTEEDFIAIEKAREEKRLGKLTSLEDVKKELGL